MRENKLFENKMSYVPMIHSQEARVEAEKKEKKQQTLAERREKLKRVLDEEQKLYEDEVKVG